MVSLLRQVLIILGLSLSWQAYAIKLAHTPPLCEDFLANWQKKPKELQFSGCRYEYNPQSDRSIAQYTLSGTKARVVESFLGKNFKMAPLKFICCGWEPTSLPGSYQRYGGYRDRSGYYYEIIMGSGETLEKDWDKIPNFYVSVVKYMRDI